MTRGEIYYINKDINTSAIGREMYPSRPGVIVSNDTNNEFSGFVQVVYPTTQPKKDLPTHVTVRSARVVSTALCEQIHTVSKDRISDYLGKCTEKEMTAIDAALCIQLALKQERAEPEKKEPDVGPVMEIARKRAAFMEQKARIELETERDTYKKLYEDLLAKMIRKARKYDQGDANNA
jgi:mRNA interferase MazF